MDFVFFGKQVNRFRRKRGMTLVECASLCGIQKDHLSKIEAGKAIPKPKTLIRICNALEVMPDVLLQDVKKIYRVFTIEEYLQRLNKASAGKVISSLSSLLC